MAVPSSLQQASSSPQLHTRAVPIVDRHSNTASPIWSPPFPCSLIVKCQKANVVSDLESTCSISEGRPASWRCPSVVEQRLDPTRRAGDTWPIGHKEPEPTEPPRMLDPIDPRYEGVLKNGKSSRWITRRGSATQTTYCVKDGSKLMEGFQVGCWTKERMDGRRALSRLIGRNFTILPHCAIGTCKRSVFLRETVLPFDEHGMHGVL